MMLYIYFLMDSKNRTVLFKLLSYILNKKKKKSDSKIILEKITLIC